MKGESKQVRRRIRKSILTRKRGLTSKVSCSYIVGTLVRTTSLEPVSQVN